LAPHIAGLLRLAGEATLHRSRARLNPELQSTLEQQRPTDDRKPAPPFSDRASNPELPASTEQDRPANANQEPKIATKRRPSQADILIGILDGATLFHAPDGTAYADVEINGRRETWKVRSPGFREWLVSSFYRKTCGAPNNTAIQQALSVADAKARYGGSEHPVHVRIGGVDGKIYIDLTDADWRAIEISETGWTVVNRPPIRFVRSKGMLPLPEPVVGGSIEKLRDFIHVKTDADFILVIAWVLAALRDTGPYPVLTVIGEHGTAKSTLMEFLRMLIDPNDANLRSPPREARDLFIAAGNAHVLAYDNLSGLPAWLSDGLARISTGAALATRQLYADQDEVLMKAEKPIALNGITDIVNRADLADRCLFVMAEPILEKDRKPKGELLAAFKTERPRILGALLDAIVLGLKTLPTVRGANWPRMADFAKWGTACEGAYAEPGAFMAAYMGNRAEAAHTLLDDDLVAMAVQKIALPWSGTATALVTELNRITNYVNENAKDWPKDGRALSRRLRQLAPPLRSKGIDCSKLPRTSAMRGWALTAVAPAAADPHNSSSSTS
jgi:hypothetical protein